MSCPSLHCSEFEQLKAALLVFYRFQICGVFAGAAVDGLCSPQHSTTRFNQLIKCNMAMYSTASASTLSRPYSFVLKFWTRSSWVIWFAINEYCCLSKPLFHWIHSQPVLRYFCWKWKVKSGSRSKTGIFPGLSLFCRQMSDLVFILSLSPFNICRMSSLSITKGEIRI